MAGTLVGRSILSASFHVLLEKLASSELVDFFRQQKLDDGFLKKLKRTLLILDAVVDDADQRQFKDHAVKLWLNKLEDVSYQVEDLLDEISHEALRCKLESESPTKPTRVMNLFSTSSLTSRNKVVIKNKIKEIDDKLQVISMEKDKFNLTGWISSSSEPIKVSSTSIVSEYEVYGRDQDKEALIKLLLSEDVTRNEMGVPEDVTGNGIGVIPIVGMVGIGKTTLAQLVYNDDKVKEHFEVQAWVCVSQNFDVFEVTKSILEAISWQSCEINNLYSLQSRLKESLEGRRFLLVLDDVWSENYSDWDILLSPLRVGAHGSRIVVTTRSERVASIMDSIAIYHLKLLLDADCYMLITDIASGNRISRLSPEEIYIVKEIAKMCQGLPLAAKVVGGFLRSKPEITAWEDVLQRQSFLLHDDMGVVIIPALRLSYDHLPSHLKRCFAYCSIFPRGYEFEKEKLVLLWMAEGLLQQSNKNKRPEEVGDAYFNDLLCWSFFHQSSGNKSRFIMHNLMNDLAQVVSGGSCFRSEDDKMSKFSDRVRHFSFIRGKNDSENLEYIYDAKFLRTFLPFKPPPEHVQFQLSNKLLKDLLSRLQCLRVLCLSHYHITQFPDTIGSLKLLRYLDLSHTAIERLSNSVSALCNLQTLLLSNCRFLTELPTDFVKLINLRHLDISGTCLKEMPPEMHRLESLQTLTNFIVGKNGGSRILELGFLSNLHGTLCISELHNVVSAGEASKASLRNKLYLDGLVLQWSDSPVYSQKDKDVLDQLQPHTDLEKLSIKFYGGTRFPDWLGDSSFFNMVFLHLSNCIYCSVLPPLGQLPSLRDLIIEGFEGVQIVGFEFYGMNRSSAKPFQSLKTLKFERMLGWTKWIFPADERREFPCLEELYILKCPMLRSNIHKSLSHSVRVEVFECPELVSTLPRSKVIDELQSLEGDTVQFRSDDELGSPSSEHRTEISVMSYDLHSQSSAHLSENSSIKYGGASKSPLYMTQIANVISETDVPINTWYTQDSSEDASAFESLKVSEVSELMDLPPWLHSLKIEGCDALKSLPEGLMRRNPDLQHLHIIDCCSLKSFPGGHPPSTLKTLYIRDCRKLEFISPAEIMRQYVFIEHLCIGSSCDSLMSFPLAFFPKLRSLSVWDCANFSSIIVPAEGLGEDFRSLDALEIRDCPKLESFPKGGLPTPNLTSIFLSNCKILKALPEQFHRLMSLQSLFINECPEIVSLPEGGLPPNLSLLCITSCTKLTPQKNWGLHKLEYLSSFEIEGGCRDVVSFPEENLLPSNLNSLRISKLLNMKLLNYKGLQHLTCLETLEINCCNKLQSLPEEGLPSSLSSLCINECSLLRSRLQHKSGKDWYKIAHIPHIQINEDVIS